MKNLKASRPNEDGARRSGRRRGFGDFTDDFACGRFVGGKDEVAKLPRCKSLAATGNAVFLKAIFKELRQGSVVPGPDLCRGCRRIPRLPGEHRWPVATFGQIRTDLVAEERTVLNSGEELFDLRKIAGEHPDYVSGPGHGEFKDEMITSGLHMMLNPRFPQSGDCVADCDRIAPSPCDLNVLLTLFFIQRTATKLCRDECRAANGAEFKTRGILDMTNGTILERGRMKPCPIGILCWKRLDDQLRFTAGTSSEECRTSGRAVVACLRSRGPGSASHQRSRSKIQGPIEVICENVNRGYALRDGTYQAAKGTLRTRGNLGFRKNGGYKIKLVRVATGPQEPRRIRARLLVTKRGDQRCPARGAFLDCFTIFCSAQRTILHGFLI